MAQKFLKEAFVEADARNRLWRTLYSGLGIDIAVAVALSLGVFLATNNGWSTIEWAVLSYSIFKSMLQAVVSYVIRKWGDRSPVPTPPPLIPQNKDIEVVGGISPNVPELVKGPVLDAGKKP